MKFPKDIILFIFLIILLYGCSEKKAEATTEELIVGRWVSEGYYDMVEGEWVRDSLAEGGDFVVEYGPDGYAKCWLIDPDTVTELSYPYSIDAEAKRLANPYQTHDLLTLNDSILETAYHLGITETGDTVYGNYKIRLKRLTED
ncbi:MAG: hypothetical protein LIP03_08005 [Bacteroidales bacterium]|nr:hypothetical protein [Bacteroidales bacterium]